MTITTEVVKAEFEITDNYEVLSYQWAQKTVFTAEELEHHLEDGLRILQELRGLLAEQSVEDALAAKQAQLLSDIDNGIVEIIATERIGDGDPQEYDGSIYINGNEREL